MDYFEVTSPVVKLDSLWIILAVAIQNWWAIETMDVKGTYLNSTLDEEIYMCQPDGFDDGSGHVLKLHRAIYGLKQSGRSWYKKLTMVLFDDGFTCSHADDCIFYKKSGDPLTIITIYVDDLGLFASTRVLMARVKHLLHSNIIMKDLGEMLKILGIRVEIDPQRDSIKLSQGHYINVLVKHFNLVEAPPVDTPVAHDIKTLLPWSASDHAPDVPYAQVIGSLMYAALGSCPDIAFAVQQLSCHTHNYTEAHWTAVKRIIRYLKGTRNRGITLCRSSSTPLIEIYADADFAGLADSHSIGGYFCLYNGCVVARLSKKQTWIALLTTESESMALIPGAKHALWVSHLHDEHGLPCTEPIHVYCDNLQTISNIQDASHHPHTKHLHIKCHWTCELVAHDEASITYVKSADNITDVLTNVINLF